MRPTLSLLCCLLLFPVQALAYTDYDFGPFILRELHAGETFADRYDGPPGSPPVTVTNSFTTAQMQANFSAFQYWQERVQGTQEKGFVLMLAKVITGETAYSSTPRTGRNNLDLYYYLVDNTLYPPQAGYNYHTGIISNREYKDDPTRQLLDDDSITATITHEFMHALGMLGTFTRADEGGVTHYRFIHESDAWIKGVHDIFGTKAAYGSAMEIKRTNGTEGSNDGVFYMPKAYADVFVSGLQTGQKGFFPTFHGAEVDALTGGKGMPLMAGARGADSTYELGPNNVLGHPALLGSVMSYAPMRNRLFSELELATLKDMGYKNIDLKKSYGKSYYPTNLGGALTKDEGLITATGGYLAETALAVTNLSGFDSDYSYGVGLHVYRDKLDVTQGANITASGYGATGIRVDGVANTVTVPGGVTVAANGSYGTGLLVSYGKNNILNVAGDVQANGYAGIGAHFGITEAKSTRGHSYNTTDADALENSDNKYFYTKMNSDLNGALVKDFNIFGKLSGRQAAIEINASAHVANINVLAGAVITGDIHSSWARNAEEGDHATAINFGTAATAGHMVLAGDIKWTADNYYTVDSEDISKKLVAINSLDVTQQGGYLHFNGKANVQQWNIAQGATLGGNNDITVNSGQSFVNAGTIAPGNSVGKITINGKYQQAASGTLLMEFNASQADALVVRGGTSSVAAGAKLVLLPLRDFYASGAQRVLSNVELFGAGAGGMLTQNAFATSLASMDSPTLTALLDRNASGEAIFSVQRSAQAYSQYADNKNSRHVGAALSGIGRQAQGDMQNLLVALDFSNPDGSNVTEGLKQLSPASYGYSAQASAEANLMLGRTALGQLRFLTVKSTGDAASASGSGGQNSWGAFVTPFASYSVQKQDGNIQGYNSSQAGLMGGLYTQRDALSLGVYTAIARRQTNTWTTTEAETLAMSLHLGGMALWQPEPTGWNLFAQAQLGFENVDGTRDIQMDTYNRQNESFCTAFSGTAMLGGGWQWQMDNVNFGPYVGLEYALNMVPQMQERQGQATRLNIEAFNRHDLRGVLGASMAWSTALGNENEGRQFKATVDAAWRQDLLNSEYTMRSSFAGYGDYAFDTTIQRQGTGSLGLSGSLQWDVRKDVSLSAHVQAEVLRPGYNALGGGMSVRWEF